MTQRLNAFAVAPDGLAALVAVEKYLYACGLAPASVGSYMPFLSRLLKA